MLGGSQGSLLPIPSLPGAPPPPAARSNAPAARCTLRAACRPPTCSRLPPTPTAVDGTLPIVDQHGLAMPLSGLELPQLMGHEHDVASQVRDTNCSAQPRALQHVPASAPISDDEVDQDDDEDDDEDEAAAAAAAAEGNETGSSGRPGRGVKRKKAGKGGKRTGTPVSGVDAGWAG